MRKKIKRRNGITTSEKSSGHTPSESTKSGIIIKKTKDLLSEHEKTCPQNPDFA